MSGDFPFVSVIVPCYQEFKYVGQFMDSVISQDYPKDQLEVIIADGNSNDGTRDIINKYIDHHGNIKLVDNPRKNQTIGLNIAINCSKGDVIVRMDVHAIYPPTYVSSLVSAQKRLNAWNVGCPLLTLPSTNSPEAFTVAAALSSPFGVGDAHYRIGNSKERLVDTVPFGCFPRTVFDQLGLYNEEFLKNEDDEFNARIVNHGGSIYLLPTPVITYFARDTKNKLFSMLFQYGYYKPKVNMAAGNVISIRQLIPPLFVLYCFLLPVIAFLGFFFPFFYLLLVPITLYLILLLYFSLRVSLIGDSNHNKLKIFLNSIACFIGMHFAYGNGYLQGIVGLFLKREKTDSIVGITR